MSRLIDADALIDNFGELTVELWLDSVEEAEIVSLIGNAPTIDAVEVVRCAECAYCNIQNTKYLYAICMRHGIEFKPFEDDTRTHGCAWGERKESE